MKIIHPAVVLKFNENVVSLVMKGLTGLCNVDTFIIRNPTIRKILVTT